MGKWCWVNPHFLSTTFTLDIFSTIYIIHCNTIFILYREFVVKVVRGKPSFS